MDKNIPRSALNLSVRACPGRPSQGRLIVGERVLRCALGRGGISAAKREGDGATPLATMPILYGFVRKGRMQRRSPLPLILIRPDLGWCEVPGDRNYNRAVKLPYAVSHETIMRPDNLYDVVIVLGWNIRPRVQGRGSAIFLHLARPGYTPTEGCVAISSKDMAWLLSRLSHGSILTVLR